MEKTIVASSIFSHHVVLRADKVKPESEKLLRHDFTIRRCLARQNRFMKSEHETLCQPSTRGPTSEFRGINSKPQDSNYKGSIGNQYKNIWMISRYFVSIKKWVFVELSRLNAAHFSGRGVAAKIAYRLMSVSAINWEYQ